MTACSGEECYCAMDKGAINGGHVLLLPIEHFPSSLSCSENAWAEMQRYLSALKACAASQVPPLAVLYRCPSMLPFNAALNAAILPSGSSPSGCPYCLPSRVWAIWQSQYCVVVTSYLQERLASPISCWVGMLPASKHTAAVADAPCDCVQTKLVSFFVL